jgi:hypothetical protein
MAFSPSYGTRMNTDEHGKKKMIHVGFMIAGERILASVAPEILDILYSWYLSAFIRVHPRPINPLSCLLKS